MKKNILFLFVIIITVNLHAQELTEIMYVANKKGLNVYEKPFTDAKITGKLSYGQKVIAFEWSEEYHRSINQAIDKEGLDSCWQLIKYNHMVTENDTLPV
ncbi:MAG: SH3 domain-containing protein [Chitinophagaceae bacterium]|nr:SH3 domain-containing protein [Chitinophagaceae bacterium]